MNARELVRYLAGLGHGWSAEDGVRFGDADRDINGIFLCWMANREAIARAAASGFNTIVCHEDLLFPPGYVDASANHLAGPVNNRRLGDLAAAGITVIRAHVPLDRLCILEDFSAALELPDPVMRDLEQCYRIYEIAPIPIDQYIERVKRALGLDHVRVSAPEGHLVRRIGLVWGGLGLSLNAGFIQSMLEFGPDTLIAGEADEYSFYAVRDAGVALIETSHSTSENPGLEHVARQLRGRFAQLRIEFFGNPRPYVIQ